jgi:inorganic triphosphatase YgiF
MTVHNISIKREPEIQYDAVSKEGLDRLERWILSKGGKQKKVVHEDSPYFDTKNNRLIREGMECRLKQKGGVYRTDLKTPLDTRKRSVEPDHMGVIWRYEICGEALQDGLALSEFSGLSILRPVKKRVSRIFDKPLHIKFRAQLHKTKFNRKMEVDGKKGVIEYALQKGHIVTPDGKRKSEELFIVEIENKSPHPEILEAAIREFEREFPDLKLLEDRKVLVGFKLIAPEMTEKARSKFDKLQRRLDMAQGPKLEAA